MPKQTKICRVCGASYEACRSIKTGSTVFNWREVACSPECGKVYLQRIMDSRNQKAAPCNSGDLCSEEPVQRSVRKKKSAQAAVTHVEDADPAHEINHTDTEMHPEEQ